MEQGLRMTPAALGAAMRGDFDNMLVAATPGGIERQEAEGQRALVSSFKQLPKQMDADGGEWRDSENGWRVAELFGFKRLGDADDIFALVEAPAGWSLKATSHSMHSDIIDDKGRVRGSVFYKAAFYDRNADGRLTARFQIKHIYPEDRDGPIDYTMQALDTATGEVLRSADILNIAKRDDVGDDAYWKLRDARDARTDDIRDELAQVFVDAGYPDWRKAEFYWD